MEKEMELIMLGTGHAMVTKCYNACFALRMGERYFLVDAGGGNGILAQMEKAKIPFPKVQGMFVTHAHTDHILGVVWVIRKVAALMRQGDYAGNFIVYCHDKVERLLRLMCEEMLPRKFSSFLDREVILETVKDGDKRTAAGMAVTFFDIHSVKEKQFGFLAVLPDGQKFACLGDEPFQETCRAYVAGCDWLLCEAFCLDRDKEIFKPYEKKHSTALDAGKVAKELGARRLALYHMEDSCLTQRKERYIREAQIHFGGKVYAPDDLERIRLGAARE